MDVKLLWSRAAEVEQRVTFEDASSSKHYKDNLSQLLGKLHQGKPASDPVSQQLGATAKAQRKPSLQETQQGVTRASINQVFPSETTRSVDVYCSKNQIPETTSWRTYNKEAAEEAKQDRHYVSPTNSTASSYCALPHPTSEVKDYRDDYNQFIQGPSHTSTRGYTPPSYPKSAVSDYS